MGSVEDGTILKPRYDAMQEINDLGNRGISIRRLITTGNYRLPLLETDDQECGKDWNVDVLMKP